MNNRLELPVVKRKQKSKKKKNLQGIVSTPARNSWGTPTEVFRWASQVAGPFDLDAAASEWNAKCHFYFNEKQNGLTQDWSILGSIPKVWLNPPYSTVGPWLEKARVEARKGCTVAVLVNADHTTGWYKQHVYNYQEQCFYPGVKRIDYPKRIRFDPPRGVSKATTNPFPSMLVVFSPTEENRG